MPLTGVINYVFAFILESIAEMLAPSTGLSGSGTVAKESQNSITTCD